MTNIRNLVATYGVLVGTNYLVVFVLLLFFYWQILRWIGRMRKQHSEISVCVWGGGGGAYL